MKLHELDRAISLQCRVLLGAEAARILNEHSIEICEIVSQALDKFQINIPTYEQWEKVYDEFIRKISSQEQDEKPFVFYNKSLSVVVRSTDDD